MVGGTGLRTPRIKEWREGLRLSKGTSNRTLIALKAALNLAVANRLVHPIAAREWADVKAYSNATQRRSPFLDLRQRRKLLRAGEGALKDLMEAAALTGHCPGRWRCACGYFCFCNSSNARWTSCSRGWSLPGMFSASACDRS